MATSDSELIDEVRSITNYTSDIFTDAEMQALVDIGKEELRADFGNDSFTFYASGPKAADRALFWFVAIASRVKAGEIAGINISLADFDAEQPEDRNYLFWFNNFQEKKQKASRTIGGSAVRNIERDDRSYSYERR